MPREGDLTRRGRAAFHHASIRRSGDVGRKPGFACASDDDASLARKARAAKRRRIAVLRFGIGARAAPPSEGTEDTYDGGHSEHPPPTGGTPTHRRHATSALPSKQGLPWASSLVFWSIAGDTPLDLPVDPSLNHRRQKRRQLRCRPHLFLYRNLSPRVADRRRACSIPRPSSEASFLCRRLRPQASESALDPCW